MVAGLWVSANNRFPVYNKSGILIGFQGCSRHYEYNLFIHFHCSIVTVIRILTYNVWIRSWTATINKSINEPQHDKTNNMASAPGENSDQPGHPPSMTTVSLCVQLVAKGSRFIQAGSEDFYQTGLMARLIWVIAGRTGHFVGFVVLRLKHVSCCSW